VSPPTEPTRTERTREALRQAALDRFLADGFDSTTIAQIADDAGVTVRTFYRHFASKDEVLFADYEARLDWFRRALELRPRRESITRSVLAAVDSFPDDPQVVSEIARLRARELDQRRIEPHIRRVQAELASEIEAHLRRRQPEADPLVARVTAQAISAAVFAALDTWMAGGDHDLDELSRLTEQAIEVVERGLAPKRRPPPSPS
jgi:AcrR family transcriptional regulator